MELVRSGMVQEVIITRLDRLARSLLTLRKALDEFQASGVNLKALDDSIDLQSAAGKFHINLLGAVAEMESDRLSERIKHGWNHFRSHKSAIHSPLGYTTIEERHELDVFPFLCLRVERLEKSKFDIARELVETYLERRSLATTCRTLNKRYGFQIFGPSALEFQNQELALALSAAYSGRWIIRPVQLVSLQRSPTLQPHQKALSPIQQ